MVFRDDRQALLQRLSELEGAAAEAEALRRKLAEVVAENQRLTAIVGELRARLAPPDVPRSPARPAPGSSCFQTEIAQGAKLCLRFDQVIANIHEGPLELRATLPCNPLTGPGQVQQRILWSDGHDELLDPKGELEFHEAHQHYHDTGFALSRLFAADLHARELPDARDL